MHELARGDRSGIVIGISSFFSTLRNKNFPRGNVGGGDSIPGGNRYSSYFRYFGLEGNFDRSKSNRNWSIFFVQRDYIQKFLARKYLTCVK